MSASTNDHQKLDRMMQSLDQQLGTASDQDKEKMHNVLDLFSAQMQNEGPEDRIYCNEGHLHYAQDINVWGSCPDMQ